MKVFVRYNFPKHLLTKMVNSIKENIVLISDYIYFFEDFTISPSVWLGTSTGSVIVANLNIIYEPRNISGTIRFSTKNKHFFVNLVVPSGTVFRLSGRMLHISFLDQKGLIIPSPSEKWETRSTLKKCVSLFIINLF